MDENELLMETMKGFKPGEMIVVGATHYNPYSHGKSNFVYAVAMTAMEEAIKQGKEIIILGDYHPEYVLDTEWINTNIRDAFLETYLGAKNYIDETSMSDEDKKKIVKKKHQDHLQGISKRHRRSKW